MFKMGLLASTAMTAVALLLTGANAAQAQTDMHTASRDPNTRFLCTFGHFNVSASRSFSGGSGFNSSAWTHVAVPVMGHGQTVSRIRVVEAQVSTAGNSAFSAGIYSNTASGLPGNPISIGTGRIGKTCGPVTISITPTNLNPGTKYWIEQTVTPAFGAWSDFNWYANPKTRRKAWVQTHYYRLISSSYSFSSTTPWTKQTMGPYFKLR